MSEKLFTPQEDDDETAEVTAVQDKRFTPEQARIAFDLYAQDLSHGAALCDQLISGAGAVNVS